MTLISSLSTIKITLNLLKKIDRKKSITFLYVITVFSAFFEVLTIGSILPLIDILLDTDKYTNNPTFFLFIELFNLDKNNLGQELIILFSILVVLSYAAKILLIFLSSYVSQKLSLDINNKIFYYTMNKDYKFHVKTNSSQFMGNINKADIAKSAIFSFFQITVSGIIASSIVFFLFILDPIITTALFFLFSGIYFIIFRVLKSTVNKISFENSTLINFRYQTLMECSENIKEIFLRKLNVFFTNKYQKIYHKITNNLIKTEIFSAVPGQIIVMSASLFIIFLVYYFSNQPGGLISNISFLGALVLSAQRLLPYFQNIYAGLLGIKEAKYSLRDVYSIIEDENKDEKSNNMNFVKSDILKINKNIILNNVSFNHEGSENKIFENLNLEFKINNIYCIKGQSGVGKTTLFDLLMGLFSLKEGEITIDGKIVNKDNIDAWQKNILHVPQTSSLIDSTILENIGYGHKLEDIDMEKAKLAAKKGEILEFIQETKNGFLTTIGEKGVRISGGQRQRLSLAKVFYNNAQLILLDEATNALDSINESKVFKNLREISKNKIILIISHGNLIEKFCDSTIEIKNLK